MIKQIAFLIVISFITVETHVCTAFSRNYLRNIENNIRYRCNLFAYNKTNNQDIFNCIKYKYTNCHLLENYSDYIKIRNECINTHHSECGMGVAVFIMIWVFVGIITNIGNTAR